MKRIIYDVPKWDLMQHREARDIDTRPDDKDPDKLALEDEIFGRLFAGDDEAQKIPDGEEVREGHILDWAQQAHGAMDANPDYKRLADEVRGDIVGSALATERLAEAIKMDPEKPPPDDGGKRMGFWLGRGARQAQQDVDEMREAIGGMAGTESGSHAQRDPAAAREMAKKLKNNARLRAIAALAGKFKRMMVNKVRHRVKHAQDDVTDITIGNEIGRLLPSELMKVRHPVLHMAFKRDYLERRLLEYELQSNEEKVRGPFVMVIDKSGSMSGEKDVWATAVALAMMEVAHRAKRAFGLISFDDKVMRTDLVKPGDPIPDAAIAVEPSGGTDIATALTHAMDMIAEGGMLVKADVVLVTDGESDASKAEALKSRAEEMGATLFGVGIYVDPRAMNVWTHRAIAVTTTSGRIDGDVADMLASGV